MTHPEFNIRAEFADHLSPACSLRNRQGMRGNNSENGVMRLPRSRRITPFSVFLPSPRGGGEGGGDDCGAKSTSKIIYSSTCYLKCPGFVLTSLSGWFPRAGRSENKLFMHSNDSLIEVRNLVKNYKTPAGDFPALKNIHLQVHPGEFLAVIGKSGAGKSTLINMISCIDSPSSGEIIFDGYPVHLLDESQKALWRCQNLGIVFQFFQLLPSLNLIENVTIAMDFCDAYPVREHKARALHLLEQVGLAEHAYKTPAKISGGQQQRVALARALANDPAVIIADEPTGNLDSRTAGEIYDLFASLLEQGKTLLVVTHDKEIARQATRSIEIADGKILEAKETALPIGRG